MDRLCLARLRGLPSGIGRPRFDPDQLSLGIVHLGLGAFHRAHQAIHTQNALGESPSPWGIAGVSLQTPTTRDRLRAQDGLYTVVARGPEGPRRTVVGTIRDALFAPEELSRVIARIADPATKIVSLTVTEKGYCRDPASGQLDVLHPDIQHDIGHPQAPRSTLGVLVMGLDCRRMAGAGPITVLSCDNLPSNGRATAGVVKTFARIQNDQIAKWIADHVAFPSTMVDRIVPATTAADIDENERALGCRDEAVVVAEPFSQWVIENRFAADRPPWEAAGAELVSDVVPYEEMKLRLLNGSHSALAYLGFLAGHEYVWQAMGDAAFARFVRRLMDEEVTPTLKTPSAVDLPAYKAALLARFANPALGHRTGQIASDGSQKLPQRIVQTVRARLVTGGSIRLLALAIAGWMRYATGIDEQGQPFEVKDPLAVRLSSISRGAGDARAVARAFLGVSEVFGDDLSHAPALADAVSEWLAQLYAKGAAATVAAA